MTTIFLRTILVYIILTLSMRLMGKRQLGELELSELVTTLLLSEIVSLPIVDQSIPIAHALVPLMTILMMEILLSVLLLKCPWLKNLISVRPSVLIRHGKADQKEMRRWRISLAELVSELRQAGVASPDEVEYAILEQNGKLSVIRKKSTQPPDAAALGVRTEESGMVHILIADGKADAHNLAALSLGNDWLASQLDAHGKKIEDVFFLGRDDTGRLFWADKE